MQGGTFTITNPGGYGTFHGTPVISQPQAAILGTYALVKRPWVVQDELGNDVIAIRPIMNLTLTYDHRLVDGALAGRFLRDLREQLETWDEARLNRARAELRSAALRPRRSVSARALEHCLRLRDAGDVLAVGVAQVGLDDDRRPTLCSTRETASTWP